MRQHGRPVSDGLVIFLQVSGAVRVTLPVSGDRSSISGVLGLPSGGFSVEGIDRDLDRHPINTAKIEISKGCDKNGVGVPAETVDARA